MPYEPTLKRNPLQLTVDQHIHTAHAISKFYNNDKKVEVIILESHEIMQRQKRAKIFSTKRTWDERSEKGYMVPIEEAFHEEIDNIKSFSDRNHEAISAYHLLWKLRHGRHEADTPDIQSIADIGTKLRKEEEEALENNRYTFLREGGFLPSRFANGLQIQAGLIKFIHSYKDTKWGLLKSTEGEFLVSDNYGDTLLIPISPTLAFCGDYNDQQIVKQQLEELNRISVRLAKEYYFAKCIKNCPIG